MRYRTFLAGLAPIVLSLIIVGVLAGCNHEPLPVPPAPPPPVTTPVETVVSSPTATIPVPSQTTTPPTESPTPVKPEELAVISNNVVIHFPDEIVFSVTARGPAIIKTINLKYGSDQRSLVPETSSSETDFSEGKEVSTSWTWKMKKTGSIPPGVTIWWQWEITDAEGNMISTEKQSTIYSDTRFQWIVKEYMDFDIYWHDQSDAMINELLDAIQLRLARIELNVQIPAERKPKVFIYTSSAELKDAVLFEQEWTGALAYPSYNIILTAVSSDIFDWAKDTLPHEITHLLVGEATFGPFGDTPTWLDEGLAEYAEIKTEAYEQQALDTAKNNGTLIPIGSLSGTFPTSGSGAFLAYAESRSIVSFLIGQYNWDKMRRLLATFKDGATNDNALMTVYSFNVNGLEVKWKNFIGAK